MFSFLHVFAAFLFFCQGYCKTRSVLKEVHHDMTPAERSIYFGASSNNEVLPEYEIAYPLEANEKGEKVPHGILNEHSRSKRNIGKEKSLYFNVQAFGFNMLLNVSVNPDILDHNFAVKVGHVDGKTTSLTPAEHVDHFIGSVVSHPKSTVAVSRKHGLHGMIKLDDETYFIQPLPHRLVQSHKRSSLPNPHIIVKKSTELPSYFEYEDNSFGKEKQINHFWRQSPPTKNGKLKREITSHKYLKAVYVVDQYAVSYFGKSTLTTVLPVMANIVAGLYRDESFGEIKLNYVLEKIFFLNNKELPYFANATISEKLKAISYWVSINNFKIQDKPGQIDSVTLISSIDKVTKVSLSPHYTPSVCPRSHLGRAYIGTICTNDEPTSSVANIAGISSASVIAHEIFHNLGGVHDNSEDCPNKEYLMSTSVSSGSGAFTWSSCSRNYAQKFLSSGASSCFNDPPSDLEERPSVSLESMLKFPGEIYDADKQCEIQYGITYKECPSQQEQCESLYCTDDNRVCHTSYSPPLDGTRCGVRHWCIKGECVDNGSPITDGGWGEWSDYGSCTTLCGGGVQHKTRKCNNPSPANGGMNCEGGTRGHYRICNEQSCPDGSDTFRQTQCSAKGNYAAFIKSDDPCSLICRSGNTIYWLGKVKDGTRCYEDDNILDVCVQGHCKKVGCDHGLESGKTFDRCRVCAGDGSSCELKIVNYTTNYRKYGFVTPGAMVTLPTKSSSVVALQKSLGYNMIGIQSIEGEYLINLPTWSKSVDVAGTTISYIHEDNRYKDMIYIPGPTHYEINLVFIYLYERNQGVDISYYSPSDENNNKANFTWHVSDWSSCSRSCATGLKTRLIKCVRNDDMTDVGYDNCPQSSKPDIVASCNTQPCPPEWYVTPWQTCSHICGKGNQQRSVTCRQKLHENTWRTLANESSCSEPRPVVSPLERECNQINCPPEYVAKEWSECSTTCSPGIMTRKLQCQRRTSSGLIEELPDHLCKEYGAVKLPTTEICNMDSPCEPPPQFKIACFELDTTIFPTVLHTFNLDYEDVSKTVRQCAKLAHYNNYMYFGLANGGECRVGPNLPSNYFKQNTSRRCYSSVGGINTIFVYTLDPLPEISPVGCFGDKRQSRSMPKLIKNFRNQIDWYKMERTVEQCARVARGFGYQYFGVQFYGECWSGLNAKETYNKYHSSEKCWEGVGEDWANFVYKFN